MTTLAAAYDQACAVFTRPVSFVEWKMYSVPTNDPKRWGPFGVSKDKSTAYREIKTDLWIYVFRRFADVQEAAVWVAELLLHKGELSAAPVEPQLNKIRTRSFGDAKDRPKPVAIGKTTTFARRINGAATWHHLFASRVRLSLATVDKLMKKVADWAPAYTFEKDDINVVGEKDGALLVAVLDPITIAVHLHTYAEVAAQDCMDYCGESADGLARRQGKVLLAQILQALLAADTSLYKDIHANEKWNPYAVDEFLVEYNAQAAYRRRWRDRWHNFLANWLDSEPFHIAQLAYREAAPVEFLVIFCECIKRLSDSRVGRDCLLRMVDGKPKKSDHKWAWVSQYLFPQDKENARTWEIIEKAGGNTIEAMKEWAPFVSTKAIPPEYIIKAINVRLAVRLGLKPAEEIISRGTGHVPFPQFWKNRRGVEFVQYQIKEGHAAKLKASWAAGFAWADMTLKAITAAFIVHEIAEAFGGEGTPQKKALAIVAGVHVITNLGAVATELKLTYKEHAAELAGVEVAEETVRRYKVAAGTLACIAAATDMVIGAVETINTFQEGETGEAVGHMVSTIGYGFEFVGALATLAGSSAGGPIVMIGATIVIIGNIVVKVFKKTDYEIFVQHCAWGKEHGESGPEKEWAVKPFAKWRDQYDVQLKSLIELLCRFEIETMADREGPSTYTKGWYEVSKDIRAIKVKLGWLPVGTQIEVRYLEAWGGAGGNHRFQGWWEVTGETTATAKKGNTLAVTLKEGEMWVTQLGPPPRKDLVVTTEREHGAQRLAYNERFQFIKVAVRLVLSVGKEAISIPYEENKLKMAVQAKNPMHSVNTDDPMVGEPDREPGGWFGTKPHAVNPPKGK